MTPAPIVDDGLPLHAEPPGDFVRINQVVEVDHASHVPTVTRGTDSGGEGGCVSRVAEVVCDSRNAVAPAMRKHPGAWTEP